MTLPIQKKKNGPSKRSVATGVIATIVMIALLLLPTPSGLSIEGYRALILFSFGLVMWVARPIPIYQTSIILILLLPLLGVVEDQEVAFGTLGFDIIWLMVSAFVLSSAINKTNLGQRVALSLITKLGTSPKGSLLALTVVNFVLAFFVPSTTARAALTCGSPPSTTMRLGR